MAILYLVLTLFLSTGAFSNNDIPPLPSELKKQLHADICTKQAPSDCTECNSSRPRPSSPGVAKHIINEAETRKQRENDTRLFWYLRTRMSEKLEPDCYSYGECQYLKSYAQKKLDALLAAKLPPSLPGADEVIRNFESYQAKKLALSRLPADFRQGISRSIEERLVQRKKVQAELRAALAKNTSSESLNSRMRDVTKDIQEAERCRADLKGEDGPDDCDRFASMCAHPFREPLELKEKAQREQAAVKEILAAITKNSEKFSPADDFSEKELKSLAERHKEWIGVQTRNEGFRECGLTPAELQALRYYTSKGYQELNPALRSGKLSPELQVFRDVLERAVQKLGLFKGTVHRGVTLPKAVLAKHQKGAVVSDSAFYSTGIMSGFSGDVQMSIVSKTGRFIGPFSEREWEHEVLFLPGTKFKVKDRRPGPNSTIYLELEEIS